MSDKLMVGDNEIITKLQIQIARLEERLVASDKALTLAGNAPADWQKSSSEIITRVAILEKHSNQETGKDKGSSVVIAYVIALVGIILGTIGLLIKQT